jgi:hypothetical protein
MLRSVRFLLGNLVRHRSHFIPLPIVLGASILVAKRECNLDFLKGILKILNVSGCFMHEVILRMPVVGHHVQTNCCELAITVRLHQTRMDEARQLANVASQRSETLEEWPHFHLAGVKAKQGKVKLLLLCCVVCEHRLEHERVAVIPGCHCLASDPRLLLPTEVRPRVLFGLFVDDVVPRGFAVSREEVSHR